MRDLDMALIDCGHWISEDDYTFWIDGKEVCWPCADLQKSQVDKAAPRPHTDIEEGSV